MIENYSNLNKKEIESFNNYLFKKNLYIYIIASVILTLLGIFVIWLLYDNIINLLAGILLTLSGLLFVLFVYLYYKHNIKKSIKFLLEETQNKGYINQFVFNEDMVIHNTFVDEQLLDTVKLDYLDILKIDDNEEYVFLFLSARHALIINKKTFINSSLKDFKTLIINKTQHNNIK